MNVSRTGHTAKTGEKFLLLLRALAPLAPGAPTALLRLTGCARLVALDLVESAQGTCGRRGPSLQSGP
jgi:hypothetical protein